MRLTLPACARPATLPENHQTRKRFTMTRIALIIAILGLSACETVQGMGRDITNAGQAIDNAL